MSVTGAVMFYDVSLGKIAEKVDANPGLVEKFGSVACGYSETEVLFSIEKPISRTLKETLTDAANVLTESKAKEAKT